MGEVEQRGAGDDRHKGVAFGKSAALGGKMRHDASAGVEPEGRAAGEHEGVDGGHRHLRREQRAVAQGGRASGRRDAADRGRLEQHDADAGGDARVLRRPDEHAPNVGDQVSHELSLPTAA